jgi:hypothetical protein
MDAVASARALRQNLSLELREIHQEETLSRLDTRHRHSAHTHGAVERERPQGRELGVDAV